MTHTAVLGAVYPVFIAHRQSGGRPIPTNKKPRGDGTMLLHDLDCAMIEYALELSEKADGREFDSVRGAFWEGGQAFPDSEIANQSHIQIAVRNPGCVLGYFRPRNELTVALPERRLST